MLPPLKLPTRKLPPLNSLRAFEAAGRALSFRAAAEELAVTQGAVAQQVRGLEDHLGLTLFHRLPRGLALTPEGKAYLAEVSAAFDTLTSATAQLVARPARVTISVTPTVATRLLIPRMAELRAALPGVELRTIAEEDLPDFTRDDVDVAIGLARPPFAPEVEARLLLPQDLIAVASPALVGQRPLPLDETEILSLPFVHHCLDHWQGFLGGRQPNPGPRFSLTTLAIDTAVAGQGVIVVNRALVAAELADGRLEQVMARSMRVSPDYYILRKRQPDRSAGAAALWRWCLDRLSAAGV
ncbi:LysR substrate-binding domain-containing protein [Tabrizicola oligotrophica]|uniref:LysR family transcriptional regulator n=1 Tax=Tabrizicola oligotrophica TaxID=2710650 RepID=A0A6M0QUW8_9RHOB|nr:LysR substrate-binding domain-containing protein [Tabrizicola oligotrophica]NEY90801.1 LysR family transcriptional regulator [Tabrizicola oligotrophica]